MKMKSSISLLLWSALLLSPCAFCHESDWSVGGYAGQYYDTEPAGLLTHGKAGFLDQYLVALTVSKAIWRAENVPLSLEIDGMIGQQFGLESLSEIAIAPVLSWSGFPWNEILRTKVRAGPLGASYTTSISSLERGQDGRGSQWLNFLMIEFAFLLPKVPSEEVFIRLHHRCAVYDLLNNYGANGEDFLALGYRHSL